MWERKLAGYGLIVTGSGLAAMSGWLAFQGFEAMLRIPLVGWIGPLIAGSLICLGVALEGDIRDKRYVQAGLLAVLLIGGALLDRHSGEMALAEKVNSATQDYADRKAGFDQAVKTQRDAEKQIAALTAELELMTGNDIRSAQLRLAALGLYAGKIDGERGPITLNAMQARGSEVRSDLSKARDAKAQADAIVAKGAPVSKVPFNLNDASLFATMVTFASIILAFLGSHIANGDKRRPDEELEAMEEAANEFEEELFDIADWLSERRKQAA